MATVQYGKTKGTAVITRKKTGNVERYQDNKLISTRTKSGKSKSKSAPRITTITRRDGTVETYKNGTLVNTEQPKVVVETPITPKQYKPVLGLSKDNEKSLFFKTTNLKGGPLTRADITEIQSKQKIIGELQNTVIPTEVSQSFADRYNKKLDYAQPEINRLKTIEEAQKAEQLRQNEAQNAAFQASKNKTWFSTLKDNINVIPGFQLITPKNKEQEKLNQVTLKTDKNLSKLESSKYPFILDSNQTSTDVDTFQTRPSFQEQQQIIQNAPKSMSPINELVYSAVGRKSPIDDLRGVSSQAYVDMGNQGTITPELIKQQELSQEALTTQRKATTIGTAKDVAKVAAIAGVTVAAGAGLSSLAGLSPTAAKVIGSSAFKYGMGGLYAGQEGYNLYKSKQAFNQGNYDQGVSRISSSITNALGFGIGMAATPFLLKTPKVLETPTTKTSSAFSSERLNMGSPDELLNFDITGGGFNSKFKVVQATDRYGNKYPSLRPNLEPQTQLRYASNTDPFKLDTKLKPTYTGFETTYRGKPGIGDTVQFRSNMYKNEYGPEIVKGLRQKGFNVEGIVPKFKGTEVSGFKDLSRYSDVGAPIQGIQLNLNPRARTSFNNKLLGLDPVSGEYVKITPQDIYTTKSGVPYTKITRGTSTEAIPLEEFKPIDFKGLTTTVEYRTPSSTNIEKFTPKTIEIIQPSKTTIQKTLPGGKIINDKDIFWSFVFENTNTGKALEVANVLKNMRASEIVMSTPKPSVPKEAPTKPTNFEKEIMVGGAQKTKTVSSQSSNKINYADLKTVTVEPEYKITDYIPEERIFGQTGLKSFTSSPKPTLKTFSFSGMSFSSLSGSKSRSDIGSMSGSKITNVASITPLSASKIGLTDIQTTETPQKVDSTQAQRITSAYDTSYASDNFLDMVNETPTNTTVSNVSASPNVPRKNFPPFVPNINFKLPGFKNKKGNGNNFNSWLTTNKIKNPADEFFKRRNTMYNNNKNNNMNNYFLVPGSKAVSNKMFNSKNKINQMLGSGKKVLRF